MRVDELEGKTHPTACDVERLRRCAREAVAEYQAFEAELPARRMLLGLYLSSDVFERHFLQEVRALLGAGYDVACEHHVDLQNPTSAVSTLHVRRR